MAPFEWRVVVILLVKTALARCEHQYRPKPDHKSVSVVDLVESKNTRYDPSPADLDIGRLMMKLGRFLDTQYMGIEQPPAAGDVNHTTWKLPFKVKPNGRLKLTSRLPASLRRLRLDRLSLPNGTTRRVRLSRRVQRKMLKYLHVYTHCAVRHRWKDLGVRFWPRWVRTGLCDTARSCSVPAGMTCQPARSRHLTLLRWHCQDWRRGRHCKWLHVRYPVVTRCACACQRP
ncbi:noggin-like [Pollicipes pollicipes]|uniref:noggin-like n=1 Tax=Pollicipes pollicipes TaxID=41117 RepID=UPI00188536F4|nr:noggin-like [Pollicipes pollicipes]